MAAPEVLGLTEKNTVSDDEGDAPIKKAGVHVVDSLDNMDIEAELDGLLSDLDSLDLNDGGRRPGDAPRVTLDGNLDVMAEPPTPQHEPPVRKLPSDADDALGAEIELSDDDFLAELGFGEADDGEDAVEAVEADLGDRAPLLEKIAELEQQLAAVDSKYKRSVADFDNMRKRMHREKKDAIQFANDKLVKDLLPVIDNMELALNHTGDTDLEQFADGVKMVHRLMLQQMAKYGLEPFDSMGETFDPHRHEAMAQIPSDEAAPGTVIMEAQRGFFLFTRLLRPALVTVAMENPAAKAKKADALDGDTEVIGEVPTDEADVEVVDADAAEEADVEVEAIDAAEDAAADPGDADPVEGPEDTIEAQIVTDELDAEDIAELAVEDVEDDSEPAGSETEDAPDAD